MCSVQPLFLENNMVYKRDLVQLKIQKILPNLGLSPLAFVLLEPIIASHNHIHFFKRWTCLFFFLLKSGGLSNLHCGDFNLDHFFLVFNLGHFIRLVVTEMGLPLICWRIAPLYFFLLGYVGLEECSELRDFILFIFFFQFCAQIYKNKR